MGLQQGIHWYVMETKEIQTQVNEPFYFLVWKQNSTWIPIHLYTLGFCILYHSSQVKFPNFEK